MHYSILCKKAVGFIYAQDFFYAKKTPEKYLALLRTNKALFKFV